MRRMPQFNALPGFALVEDEKEVLSTLVEIPDEAKVNMTGIGKIISVNGETELAIGDRVMYPMYEVQFFKIDDTFIAVVPLKTIKVKIDPTYDRKLMHRKYKKVVDPLTSPLALYNRDQAVARVDQVRNQYTDTLSSRFST